MANVKVKVGQVWSDGSNPTTISRVDYQKMRCYFMDNGRECSFGFLKEDGSPDDWSGWSLQKDAPMHDIVSFFKAVPDGYCPCNIIRENCDYHK